jgi:hypothetical protein
MCYTVFLIMKFAVIASITGSKARGWGFDLILGRAKPYISKKSHGVSSVFIAFLLHFYCVFFKIIYLNNYLTNSSADLKICIDKLNQNLNLFQFTNVFYLQIKYDSPFYDKVQKMN